MNFQVKQLNFNTLDTRQSLLLKKNIFQCINQNQVFLQQFYHQDQHFLQTLQKSTTLDEQSFKLIKKLSKNYQNSLIQIINLGNLASDILQGFFQVLQKWKQSEKIILKRAQDGQTQLNQYLKCLNNQNTELTFQIQEMNKLLETSNQKIQQLYHELSLQKTINQQNKKRMQNILALQKQELIKNLQEQNHHLKQQIYQLQNLYNLKNKQHLELLQKQQIITKSIMQNSQNVKLENEILQKPQQNSQLSQISLIKSRIAIANIINQQNLDFNSPVSKSKSFKSSYGQISTLNQVSNLNLKNDIMNIYSSRYSINLPEEQNKQNNYFTQNIKSYFISPKYEENNKKLYHHKAKNVGVNTQQFLMKTKIIQCDIKEKKNFNRNIKDKDISIQTLKQQQFMLSNIKIQKQLQKQPLIQDKNLIKSLVRYMSDKVIYHRIKRKN